MKLLIGYDGSACADAALHDLRRAGLPEGGEAVVLSVADVWPHLGAPSSAGLAFAVTSAAHELSRRELLRARELADGAAARVRADLPEWNVTPDAATPVWDVKSEAGADAPHWALIKKADEWKPDLVVVGSHGRSAVGRFFLGSVSQMVLTHARCSVRIGRGSPRTGREPVKLVVGLDGSPASEAALDAVCRRRWGRGSQATVVAALEPAVVTAFPGDLGDLSVSSTQYRDAAEWLTGVVKDAAEKLAARGLIVHTVVREGSAKATLVEEAEAIGADCIFVGAKGLSRLERFLIGSVSGAVAARAHCSVEVVRQSK